MCVPFSQNLKKKSVTGEQNMKILRKKRRNWPKKCQRKGKNKKTRQWISTTDQLHWQVTEWKLGDSQRSWNSKPQNKTSTNRKLEELKTQAQKALNLVEIIGLDLQLLKLKDPNSTDSFSTAFSTTNSPNPQSEHGSVASPKSKYSRDRLIGE